LISGTNRAVLPSPPNLIPSKKSFEFFVDFEYFTSSNLNFETQWPGLEGFEMIFLVGVGSSN